MSMSMFVVAAVSAVAFAGPATAALPNNRAYEQVSEVNKAGQDAGPALTIGTSNTSTTMFASATAAGTAFMYGSYGVFAGALSGFPNAYVARRTDAGWATTAISPPTVEPANAAFTMNTSTDLSRYAFVITGQGVGLSGQGAGLYLREADGSFIKASPGAQAVTYRVGTGDGRHHVFESTGQLIPGVPPPSSSSAPRVYEWFDGQLRLVDRLPGSNLPSTYGGNAGGGGSGTGLSTGDTRRAISEDGSAIAFISPGASQSTTANPSRLYLRIDGETTVEASRSRCDRTAPDPPCNAPAVIKYQDFADDGSRVLFATTQQLVNDDVDTLSDVYSYDVAEDSLTRLSPGIGGATFVTAASSDAQVVYLSAAVNKKIYLSDHGAAPRLVALTTGFAFASPSACPTAARASKDGSIFVFTSSYPVEDANGVPGPIGLYHYDSDGAGTVTRVATGPVTTYGIGNQGCRRYSGLSADGEYLVFETPNKLLDADVNTSQDVYQWHDGTLSLISAGTGDDSRLMMTTPDGKDVFFTTWDRLTPSDTDAAQDIYTARIGGGIAVPSGTPPCAGDDCQGTATTPPQQPAAGSALVRGKGNALSPGRGSGVKLGLRAKVKGSKATLRVRAPKAGRITATGPRVKRAVATVAKSKVRTIKLTLTRKAKRALARNSSLEIRVRVKFVARDGGKSAKSVRFKLRTEGRR
jgi:hypothetical protein